MRRHALILFHLSAAALFVSFVTIGVVSLPFWTRDADDPIERAEFDSARYQLARAEHALRSGFEAESPNDKAVFGQVALDHVNRSLSRRPLNPHAWQARALAHELLNKTDGALEDYRASLRMGPFERTLAVSRIDFALRHWSHLSIEERRGVRDEPPPLSWSTVIFRKRRIRDGEQATQTGGDCHQAAAG